MVPAKRGTTKYSLAGVSFVGVLLTAALASAQPADPGTRELARQAYDRGASALARDDFATAATEFLRADATAPSDIALGAAASAAARAGDPGLAARVLNHAEGRTMSRDLATSVQSVRDRFAARLGRIRVQCQAKTCVARHGGEEIAAGTAKWVVPGHHVVDAQVDDAATAPRNLDATADAESLVVLQSATPPPPAAPPPADRGGLPATTPAHASTSGGVSPVWFWVAGGATVLAAGFATWSTIDLLGIRSDYDGGGCERASSTACTRIADDGQSAQLRNGIAWAATGVLAATTAVLGLFLVRWSGGEGARVGIAPIRDGAVGTLGSAW